MNSAHKSRSYRPPKTVVTNATRGAELQQEWHRGGVDIVAVSVNKGARAGLAGIDALSWDAIKGMKDFFDMHPHDFSPDDVESDGGPNESTINWLLYGGTAGKDWATKILSQSKEDNMAKFNCQGNIIKVDESLGLVMGWAIISKQDGEDYYDLQKDHIPEDAMMAASVDFMQSARIVGDMHKEEEGGQVVFAFPMTTEVAKAFGIVTKTTGLMIAIKPKNQKTLDKFKDGTYNGFSIGGTREKDEEVD